MRPGSAKRLAGGYTFVEVMIVILVLAIIALMVAPKYASASNDAKEAQLATDVQLIRTQVNLYIAQHNSRGPHLNERGADDRNNTVNRLIQRTTPDGKLDPNGDCGPYLNTWPANPFVSSSSLATLVRYGTATAPTRNNTTGWYYSTRTCIFSPNSSVGAKNLDPS